MAGKNWYVFGSKVVMEMRETGLGDDAQRPVGWQLRELRQPIAAARRHWWGPLVLFSSSFMSRLAPRGHQIGSRLCLTVGPIS